MKTICAVSAVCVFAGLSVLCAADSGKAVTAKPAVSTKTVGVKTSSTTASQQDEATKLALKRMMKGMRAAKSKQANGTVIVSSGSLTGVAVSTVAPVAATGK